MGSLSPADAAVLRNHFLNDVAAATLAVIAITDHHYAEAERLLVQYGSARRLRTLRLERHAGETGQEGPR